MNKLLLLLAGIFLLAAVLFSPLENKVSAKPFVDCKLKNARLNLRDDELKIFALVNQERRRRSLDYLNWNGDPADIARDYSRKMAKENCFSHYDGAGDAKMKNRRKIGENLFYCQGIEDCDEFAVKTWIKSSEHKWNILNRDRTDSGSGIGRQNLC